MSFLSKLNNNKNVVAEGTANVAAKPANPFANNPFVKKGNPFAKPAAAPVVKVEKKVEAEAPAAPAAKETEAEKLAKDLLSGKKKPTPIKGQEEVEEEAVETEAEETATEEATAEEKFEQEAHAAVKAAAEDVAPEKEETADDKPAEEEKAEEAPKKKVVRRRKTKKADEKAEEATKAAEAEKTEETKAPAVVENKPAKLEKKTDSQRVLQTAHFKPVDIIGQKMSYDEACQLVLTQFNDTNAWQQYEDDVLAQLDSKELRIEADMNPGTLKAVECNLDALSTDLLRNYIRTKQLNELLTNKDFGAAYALMAEYSDGKNIIDRQQSGFRALASTDFGGSKVNMLALIATTRMHLTFLQAVMDRIKSKQNMCITMSSAIKVENSMSMMGAQG